MPAFLARRAGQAGGDPQGAGPSPPEAPTLFARGDYSSAHGQGRLEEHIVAFARDTCGSAMIVVVPRLTHRLLAGAIGLSLDPHV